MPCRPAKAGTGDPGGCAENGGIGGPGGRATVLAWIGGGSLAETGGGNLGGPPRNLGGPPRNDPWITLAVILQCS
jgi:hypothetical protein